MIEIAHLHQVGATTPAPFGLPDPARGIVVGLAVHLTAGPRSVKWPKISGLKREPRPKGRSSGRESVLRDVCNLATETQTEIAG